jgi:hypothetical protein
VDWWYWLLLGLGVTVLVWSVGVLLLVVFGRRPDAAALARFIPDCIVLTRRLLSDPRVPRRRKLLREHWPGPEQSRLLVQRLAHGRAT